MIGLSDTFSDFILTLASSGWISLMLDNLLLKATGQLIIFFGGAS